jgi:hypothetical protein
MNKGRLVFNPFAYAKNGNNELILNANNLYKNNHKRMKNLILLDFIKNQVVFEKIKWHESSLFASRIGLEIKQKEADFESQTQFDSWYLTLMENNNLQIEGYVLEDANNSYLKIKSPYYIFWKVMRSVLDNFNKGVLPNPQKLELKRAAEFYKFLNDQKHLGIEYSNIIEARNDFLVPNNK